MVKISIKGSSFEASSAFHEKDIVKLAGFKFHWGNGKCFDKCAGCASGIGPKTWWTPSTAIAARLVGHPQCEFSSDAMQLVQGTVQTLEDSRADDADIDIPRPQGLEFFPFQKAGIKFASQRKSTLIADEPGLGKTLQAIGVINADTNIKRVLVISPAVVLYNWRDEVRKWSARSVNTFVVGEKSDPTEAEVSVTICSYNRLNKIPQESEFDLLVVDESHYIKNPKAKRTKSILGDKNTAGIIKRCKKHVFLTGTPVLNRPVELWPMLHALAPHEYSNFFSFARRYCGAIHNGFGWDFSGATHMDELQIKMRSSLMIRRLKADVLTDLPNKTRQIIRLQRPSGTNSLFAREQELFDAVGGYEQAVLGLKGSGTVGFTELSKVRHEIAVAKVPQVVEHLLDMLENEGKVIVFAHHRDVQAAIIQGLEDAEISTRSILGDHSPEERQNTVREFQTDPSIRVVVCSIQAAGVGITLTAASTVVFAELDWVPAQLTQCEDRAHRIGQKSNVLVQHLVFDRSLDATMAKVVLDKQRVADAALDRDPNAHIPVVDPPKPKKVVDCSSPPVTEQERSRVHDQLRFLSARCDGGRAEDHAGFNRLDSKFGKQLASRDFLTDAQVHAAKRMLVKYRGQLSQIQTDSVGVNQ